MHRSSLWIAKLAAVAACAALFAAALIGNSEAAQTVSGGTKLPGLQTGPAPWLPEIDNLAARLKAIHLPALSQEGEALHIHQHLDIFINGKPVPVPSGIGINPIDQFISPLHTHDVSGVMHVESDVKRDFTLGQFFDVWGVRFSKRCIGKYCAKGADTLRVFVDGKPVTNDPRALVLSDHQEIAVVYGQAAAKLSVPSSYNFEE